jgi:hypothetical protein
MPKPTAIAAAPATVTAALLQSAGERLPCTRQHSQLGARRDAEPTSEVAGERYPEMPMVDLDSERA